MPWLLIVGLVFFQPIVRQATGVLDEGSKAVIDNDDQFEVTLVPSRLMSLTLIKCFP